MTWLGALLFFVAGIGTLWSMGDAASATSTDGISAEESREDLGTLVKNLEGLVREQQARIEDLRTKTQQLPHDGRSLLTDPGRPPSGPLKLTKPGEKAIGEGLNYLWLIVCGILIVFMQAGFALAEAGSCRLRNVQNVILKDVMGMCLAAICWWIFGWSFAYSGPWDEEKMPNFEKDSRFGGKYQFIGHHFLKEDADGNQRDFGVFPATIARWFLEWATCSLAVAIAGAGVAERIGFAGHCIFTALFSSFVYPLVVAASWGRGFLMDMNTSGFQDFAGSGVVHMTGGTAALVGALIARPRSGRWLGATAKDRISGMEEVFKPHSLPLVVLGTFTMWFGWYGLNGVRVSGITNPYMDYEKGLLAAQVFMNSTIAAVTGGTFLFLFRKPIQGRWDVTGCCSGILAGLVSISAAAASVEVGVAFAIAFIGSIICLGASVAVKAAKIDDPMDVIAIFFACGWWGLFAETLFDWGKDFDNFHGANGFRCAAKLDGSCLTGMGAEVSGANWAMMFFILAWVGGLTALIFCFLAALNLAGGYQVGPTAGLQNQGYDEAWHDPVVGYDLEDVMPKTSL